MRDGKLIAVGEKHDEQAGASQEREGRRQGIRVEGGQGRLGRGLDEAPPSGHLAYLTHLIQFRDLLSSGNSINSNQLLYTF